MTAPPTIQPEPTPDPPSDFLTPTEKVRTKLDIWTRFRGLLDPTAIPLLVIVGVLMLWQSRDVTLTQLQWLVTTFICTAIAIQITRILLPTFDLSNWMQSASKGNVAAAEVVRGFLIFLGIVFFSILFYAKI